MGGLEAPAHRMFPVSSAAWIEAAQRFAIGPAQQFAAEEIVYAIGEQGTPAWLVLNGGINVVRRDKLSHEAQVTTYHAGRFTGKVSWWMQCNRSGRAVMFQFMR